MTKKNQGKKDAYEKPIITYTEKLSKSDVRQLLYDYEEIKDIEDLQKIEPGTHIRYFEDKDGEMKFRTGGIMTVNQYPTYIVLANGKISWSVQIGQCIFFRRITIKEVRDEYEKELIRLDAENKGLRTLLGDISKKYNKLLEKEDKNKAK